MAVSGHFRGVRGLSWEPRGYYLVSVADDQTARLWAPWSQGRAAATRREKTVACRSVLVATADECRRISENGDDDIGDDDIDACR